MGTHCSVLIVDDDPGWQKLLFTLLREKGYEAEVTGSFTRAHNRILGINQLFNPSNLCVCVVDLQLAPDGDEEDRAGLALLLQCKANHMPTIVVSGFVGLHIGQQLLTEYGVSEVFDKNHFDEVAFLFAVENLMSRLISKLGTISRQHLKQQLDELKARYDVLTRRISALDRDIGLERDTMRIQQLNESRAQMVSEREYVVERVGAIEDRLQHQYSADS